MIDFDDRARRQVVFEELHSRGDDFLELANIGRVYDDGNDVGKTTARRFQYRLHDADGLTRLFGHVARSVKLTVCTPRQVQGQDGQSRGLVEMAVVTLDV